VARRRKSREKLNLTPKRRRAKGEGSYYRRTRILADGRSVEDWVFEAFLGFDENGRRVRRRMMAPTLSELQFKVNKLKADHAGKIPRRAQQTVGEYLEDWLAGVERSRASTTAIFYGKRIRMYAIPNIGKVLLDELGPERIAWLYKILAERGVSADNVQKLHKALRRAFNVAIGKGILRRNPCAFVERPSHRVARRSTYSAAQVARLLKAAKGDRFEAMVRLGIFAAMRPGELFALEWNDVDLRRSVVDVRHNLRERPRVLVPAKADSARRIPLERGTVAALRRHRDSRRSPFVFTTERGKMMSEKVGNGALRSIAQKARLPVLTLYGLRHTGISLLAESGAHLRIAADIAGHATTALTGDVYTHFQAARHREAVENAASLVAGASKRRRRA
jgi:integrase